MRRVVWQWLLSFALVWGASGCSCGKPPVESKLRVAYEKPTDAQRLTAADDADPAAEGFQYEVVALASDSAGREVTLESAKLEVRTPSETAWTPGPAAVIEGSRVRFPGTLLRPRTNLLQVTVVEAKSRRTATHRISVTVSTEPPKVDLTEPAEGKVLRATDDADPNTPGYQVLFGVTSTGLVGRPGTLYCEQACGVPPTDFTVNSSGVTQLTVTLTQAACEAEKAVCYAVVRQGNNEVTSARRNLTLDTVAPRVEVAGPLAPVASTTFKVEATVGCSEPGLTATLSRQGVPDLITQVVAGGVTFPAVTVPVDGDYLYTLRVADEGGNVTTREIPVTVASLTPSVRMTVPKTVTTDADGRPENGVQVPVSVVADSVPVGTEVRLFTSATGQFGRPRRAVTAGNPRTATFTAHLAEGANTVQACVSNASGIEQCTVETVTVAMGRATCSISSPLEGVVVRGSSETMDVLSGNGPVTMVAYDASGAEKGRSTGTAAGGLARMQSPQVTEGEYFLVASCPGGGISQAFWFTLDTTAPTLDFNVRGVPAGQTTLGPELSDTSVSPGMQIALDVSTEPRANVVATGCGMTAGVAGQADSSGTLVLRNVSVPPSGTCELQLRATDLAGNSTPLKKTLTLAFSGGVLQFAEPASGRYLGPADGVVRSGGGLLVTVRLAVQPTVAGTLRLLRGTTELGTQPVAASDTVVSFSNVALEEGANVLRAELTGPGGSVVCATVLLLVDTQPGTISFQLPAPPPAPAPTYLVTSDVTPDQPGIQAPLQYNSPGRSPSGVVDICSSVALTRGAAPCRDGSGWFTLATNVPPFNPEFTYPDGLYALKAVLVDGGISVSTEVPIRVDSIEPTVWSVELAGDANGDKRLNATELPSGPPELRITVGGLEDGRSVQVRSANNPNILYGQATVMGSQVTVPLTAMPTGVAADYSLVVTVTDEAGNSNRVANPTPFYPLNTAAFFSFRLDRVPPTLVVNAPTRTSLGIADDPSGAAGFQLRVSVQTDADVATGGVRLELSPSGGAVDLTPSGLVVTHEYTLPATGTVTYTLTLTATDTSGNRTAPLVRTLTVDLEAPTVDLVTPAAGAVYNSTDIPVRVEVGGGGVGTVRIYTQGGSGARTLVGDLPVANGVAQGTLNFPLGVQTVTAEASDAAGNTGSEQAAGVDIRAPGCVIALTNPADPVVTLLPGDDRDPAAAGLQYRLEGNTDCRGQTVSLFRGNSPTAEATVTADAATGDFFFELTLQDNEQTRLTVEVLNLSAVRSIDFVDVTVDLTPPVITSVSPSGNTLYFVTANNAFLFPTPAPEYVVDAAPGGDANATFTLTVTQAVGSRVQAFYRNTAVSSEFSVTTDPQTLSVPVTLPHDTAGTLELRVRDISGNVVRHSVAATVDVVAPAQPTVTRTVLAGQERQAKVEVTWTASGDDGVSGMPAGYDLRWSLNAQLPNGIQDQATYFGPKVRQETGALLPAGSTRYTLTLPPLARYFIQLRPRDEVGNYPPFEVAPAVDNFWTSLTLTNPGTNNSYGLFITGRDVNADGFDDLLVGASSSAPGTVHIYYGKANLAAAPPTRQDLTLPETDSQFFGGEFDVGDVGNATVDAVQDLLLGARGYAGTSGASSGRVFLYFGRRNAPLDTAGPIEFRNVPGVAGALLGGIVRMIGDITGDGLQELIMSSNGESPGKVYLFYGRSPDAWRALGNGCTAAAACVVPTSAADKIFEAPATTAVFFGRTRGYVRLGDITGDGVPDFTLPHSHERFNNVYVYSGATVRSLGKTLTTANALQVLNQGPNGTGNGLGGFGTDAVGGVDLAGGPGVDLVVGMSTLSRVFVYRDGDATGFSTPPLMIQGGSRFGTSLARGDLNADGRQDLAIGQNITGSSAAFVFYNRGVPGQEFDTVQENGFFQSKLEPTATPGISLTILDFNGDGKLDLAVADSQSNPARVVVYY
ncbi:MAG TPA: VCBS repeat-containing protein [Myxococcaceae bacterium]